MRKIYSIMLMAAALLISTSTWAQQQQPVAQIGTQPYFTLQEAVNAVPAGGTATIKVLKNITLSAPVVIPQVETAATDAEKVVNRAMQHITLDLNDHDITTNSEYYGSAIILLKGELNIIGEDCKISRDGTNWKGSWTNFSRSAIVVCGADGNKNDATKDRSKQEWSTLKIGKGVTIYAGGHASGTNGEEGCNGIAIQDISTSNAVKNGTYYADLDQYIHYANLGYSTYFTKASHPLWWASSTEAGCAFGVKVIVEGTVYGYRRGINIVGHINQSAKAVEDASSRKYEAYPYYDHYYPYIKVEKGGKVYCANTGLESGNGGIYGGGWCVIDICGEASGQTGVLLKGGDVVVDGGTVKSTDNANADASANYGDNVAGNAIYIASDAGYAGATSVTIEGGATIEAGSKGAAIIDQVADNVPGGTPTVEHVTITDGTIDGGAAGGIVATTGTADHTTITSATIEGGITVNGNPVGANDMGQFVPDGKSASTNPAAEPDYIVTTPEGNIKIEPNTAKNVTLNAFGLATYSFVNIEANAGKTRQLPSDVTAWVTTGELKDGVLKLTQVSGNIPEGVGVILYGAGEELKNAQREMPLTTGGAADIAEGTNKLVAASAWNTKGANDNIYVLVGNELYKYTGTEMKPNKAFLNLGTATGPNGAPKRIQMVFDETQAVDNVETTIEAVKFMENGQIFIRRGENIYNVQGQIVK